MKRTFVVLNWFFLVGLISLVTTLFLPPNIPPGGLVWMVFIQIGIIGILPAFVSAILFVLVLPHEIGHYIAGRFLGFKILFVDVYGIRIWFLGKKHHLRIDRTPSRGGMAYLAKQEAHLTDIRIVLLAGPMANVMCAVGLFVLSAQYGRYSLVDILIVLHLFVAIANLLPIYVISDGYRAMRSFQKPQESIDLFNLAFVSMPFHSTRPRNWKIDALKNSDDPLQQSLVDLYKSQHLMDRGQMEQAAPFLKNALRIVIENKMRFEPAGGVCTEAALYFSRHNYDFEASQAATNYAKKLKLSQGSSHVISGARLWVAQQYRDATNQWEIAKSLIVTDAFTEEQREFGRDWFIRLRTEDMVFETDRLIARLWRIDDAEAAFAIYGNLEVQRYLGREPKVVESLEAMQSILEKRLVAQKGWQVGRGFWALVRKDDEQLIGAIMCKSLPNGDGEPSGEIEIGWHLGQEFWGNRYATEAGSAVAQYGFSKDPELKRVLAVVYPANIASQKVATRIGMTHLGTSSEYYGIELEVFERDRGKGGTDIRSEEEQ